MTEPKNVLRIRNFHCSEHGYIEPVPKCPKCHVPVSDYERVSHTHCCDNQPSPCGIPIEKHTQCCLCDLPTPTPPPTEGYGEKAHLKWLSKTKTAKIDGSELTVLPYGYLQTAVDEAVTQALAEQKARMVEVVKANTHEAIGVNGIRTEVVDAEIIIKALSK